MALITPRELEVLNILWKSNTAMTSTEIVNAGKELTQSTVQAILRKLLKSNLVKVSGVTHSGKVLSRTYSPTISSKELIIEKFKEDYLNFSDIISKSTLFSAILQVNTDSKNSKKEIEELKVMLDNFEKEI